ESRHLCQSASQFLETDLIESGAPRPSPNLPPRFSFAFVRTFAKEGDYNFAYNDTERIMSTETLESVAKKLVAPGKGILAADESSGTIEKRLKSISVASTEENRRAYREILFTTKGAGEFISGVILFDETIRQKTRDGRTFVKALEEQGIIPGIKVEGCQSDGEFSRRKNHRGSRRTARA